MLVLLCWLMLISRVFPWPYTWYCNTSSLTCSRELRADELKFTPLSKCLLECMSGDDNEAGGAKQTVLWPRPKKISNISGKTSVVNMADIDYKGNINTNKDVGATDLQNLISQYLVPKYIDSTSTADDNTIPLTFKFDVDNGEMRELLDTSDESYTLKITSNEAAGLVDRIDVLVTAQTYFGARHAVETLSQLALFAPVQLDKKTYIVTSITVEDAPAYPWRGLSVDTSRNYIDPGVLLKIIDGLAAAKMNTFHWHLTDSHSFPFVSSSVPKMAEYGAYLPSKIYTIQTVKNIVGHARKRGIRVVPELDAPAHVGYGWQWGPDAGIGDLVVCLDKEPFQEYCNEPPCGQMNVANDELYPILKKLYGDLKKSFPNEWFHMGGDEVNFKCWETVKSITDFMEEKHWTTDYEGFMSLWEYYQGKAYEQLKSVGGAGKPKVILWSSRLTNGKGLLKLDKDNYVIQFWESTEDETHKEHLRNLIENGYRVIMSNYNELYLDCGFGAWLGAGPNNWCSPFKSWHQAYMTNIKEWLSENYKIDSTTSSKLIMGGETAIWTEQASDHDILYKVFPRTWAYAERLWSDPPKGEPGKVGSWEEAEERLTHFASLMTQQGIPSNAMKPEYCLQHGGKCVLESTSRASVTQPTLVLLLTTLLVKIMV